MIIRTSSNCCEVRVPFWRIASPTGFHLLQLEATVTPVGVPRSKQTPIWTSRLVVLRVSSLEFVSLFLQYLVGPKKKVLLTKNLPTKIRTRWCPTSRYNLNCCTHSFFRSIPEAKTLSPLGFRKKNDGCPTFPPTTSPVTNIKVLPPPKVLTALQAN